MKNKINLSNLVRYIIRQEFYENKNQLWNFTSVKYYLNSGQATKTTIAKFKMLFV